MTKKAHITKAEARKIREEAMLYQAYLDLFYAHDLYNSTIDDLEFTLKDLRKERAKTNRRFKKAEERYQEVYGKAPMKPRRI